MIRQLNQHPLGEWRKESWTALEMEICARCFRELRDEYRFYEEDIWNLLPQNCGLEGWDVLLEQRRVAMA